MRSVTENSSVKRLVISDTHIGSRFSRKEEIYELLVEKEYDQLILNGDIIEFLKVPTFSKVALEIFKVAKNKAKEVIYIIGNHDVAMSSFVDQDFENIKFVSEYCFTEGDRKFRIEHGDKYESGIVHHRTLMSIISSFQNALEKILDVDLSTWFANLNINKRKIKRLWDIIDLNMDVDVLVVGHTHMPEAVIWIDEDEKIKTYVNCGDWVQHATYVEITDGVIRLRNFLKK
jgi:UDP-2,3-diacylglucosamine pyrophosphatase LpxH